MSFKQVNLFEETIAQFYDAPYAVAVDCCTHGIELCLRYEQVDFITVPKHTYLSIPMLADKLWIDLHWKDEKWKDYYYVTDKIIDSASDSMSGSNSDIPSDFQLEIDEELL